MRTHLARGSRSFIPSDNEGAPCNCLECQAAGVTDLPLRFVPADEHSSKARWLHGEELKRWYVARDEARAATRRLFESQGLDPKKFGQAFGDRR